MEGVNKLNMAESLGSDLESDASSADGGPSSMAWSQTTATGREQLSKRVDSLQQENRVLKMELDTFRYKCKSLEEENRELKKARVTIVRLNLQIHARSTQRTVT